MLEKIVIFEIFISFAFSSYGSEMETYSQYLYKTSPGLFIDSCALDDSGKKRSPIKKPGKLNMVTSKGLFKTVYLNDAEDFYDMGDSKVKRKLWQYSLPDGVSSGDVLLLLNKKNVKINLVKRELFKKKELDESIFEKMKKAHPYLQRKSVVEQDSITKKWKDDCQSQVLGKFEEVYCQLNDYGVLFHDGKVIATSETDFYGHPRAEILGTLEIDGISFYFIYEEFKGGGENKLVPVNKNKKHKIINYGCYLPTLC